MVKTPCSQFREPQVRSPVRELVPHAATKRAHVPQRRSRMPQLRDLVQPNKNQTSPVSCPSSPNTYSTPVAQYTLPFWPLFVWSSEGQDPGSSILKHHNALPCIFLKCHGLIIWLKTSFLFQDRIINLVVGSLTSLLILVSIFVSHPGS